MTSSISFVNTKSHSFFKNLSLLQYLEIEVGNQLEKYIFRKKSETDSITTHRDYQLLWYFIVLQCPQCCCSPRSSARNRSRFWVSSLRQCCHWMFQLTSITYVPDFPLSSDVSPSLEDSSLFFFFFFLNQFHSNCHYRGNNALTSRHAITCKHLAYDVMH